VEALRRRPNTPDLAWLGGHRGLEERIVPTAGIPLRRLALRSLRSVERNVHLALDPARLAVSVPQAAAMLIVNRPDAIFTTGGYVAIPVLMAAAALRIPILLWEGNVIPGRSVRATAGLASAVAVSSEPTCASLATRRPCFVTGTPIRDLRSIDRTTAREALGIGAGDRLVLVFGGSQAVRRFNGAVADVLPQLVERAHLIHVTGDDGLAAAVAGREALPVDLRARYRPAPFLGAEMPRALAAADLVIGRAGSSTLAEVTALGIPIVVVPYPHAGNHQRANALQLADAGAGILIEDAAFNGVALLGAVERLEEGAAHARMAGAARTLGRPGAADAIADLLTAMMGRAPLPSPETIDRTARGAAA
jgi:UDP-N-acetylglucosamine--N-acetylmuramyl-(pentapeptide) pyrophosphoryl-undecaprenol N-acetylglucosamine transferase